MLVFLVEFFLNDLTLLIPCVLSETFSYKTCHLLVNKLQHGHADNVDSHFALWLYN